VLEGFPELTKEYRIVLDRHGRQDRVIVQVEWRGGVTRAEAVRDRFVRDLKVVTGLTMETELLQPGELTRSLRIEERVKTKRVWDRRGEKDV
jgi:phenylacetate-coenzyme A ligase PaaK-like adenylate-forming protein